MCGIWACFGSDEDISVQCNSAHKIAHRGPDAFRIENINHMQNCSLGFHRLAILDDLQGMQPMRLYSHPHIWLVYNGEIYNHELLRKEFNFKCSTHCDSEIIIHMYAHGGIKFAAQHLDGVFGFCLLDTSTRQVYIARDTFGVRPLFRLLTEDGFLAVCSEAKGLFGLKHHEFNDADVAIEWLPPGNVDTFQLDRNGKASFVKRQRFHKIGDQPKYNTLVKPIQEWFTNLWSNKKKSTNGYILDTDAKENIRVLLEGAVRKRMMSERRIGCLLSGGLDSSLMAALLVKFAKEDELPYPIQTFSIGMENSTDIHAARKVAKHLGTEHHEVIFTAEEGCRVVDDVIYHLESYDITTVRASVGMYLLSKYISEKTDTVVILSGEGSDEIAQGYIYFHKAPSAGDACAESRRLCEDLYMYDVLRADRMPCAWGLELRVPFLDHNFSSYYLNLPPQDKQPHKGQEKYLLRSAFDGLGLLPDEILWRPKEAFSDGISSLKTSWFEVLQEHIESQIADSELEDAPKLYPHNTPRTKEALYYRKVFEESFPNKSKWIPYFWMPKWIQADDPSARTLKHYKQ